EIAGAIARAAGELCGTEREWVGGCPVEGTESVEPARRFVGRDHVFDGAVERHAGAESPERPERVRRRVFLLELRHQYVAELDLLVGGEALEAGKGAPHLGGFLLARIAAIALLRKRGQKVRREPFEELFLLRFHEATRDAAPQNPPLEACGVFFVVHQARVEHAPYFAHAPIIERIAE